MGGETKTENATTLDQILAADEEADVDPSPEADETADAGVVGEEPVRWTLTADAAKEAGPRNGEAAAARRVTPVTVTSTRSRGWRTAAIVGLIIAGLLSAAVVLLWGQADNASSDSQHALARVASAADASDRVDVLEGTIADLQKQLADLKTSADALQVSVGSAAPTADVDAKVTALTARADQLAACVNAYMDAVGAWSRNPTGTTFTYHHC